MVSELRDESVNQQEEKQPRLDPQMVLLKLLYETEMSTLKTCALHKFRTEFVGGGCDDPDGCSPLDFVESYCKPLDQEVQPWLSRNNPGWARCVINEPEPQPNLDYIWTFPKRIDRVFCYQIRNYEDEDWMLCCQLNSGIYLLYTANCCYTGFGVHGDMTITVSRSLARLIEFGMTDSQRESMLRLQFP